MITRSRQALESSIDFDAPAIASNPVPHYETLRQRGPVHFLVRQNAWIVLGLDEVREALNRPEEFSSQPRDWVDRVLLGAGREDRGSVPKIVSRLFSAEARQRQSAAVEHHASSLLAPRMDVVSEFAQPLSDALAADVLGFDADAIGTIQRERASRPHLRHFIEAIDAVSPRAALHTTLIREGLSAQQATSLVRLLWLAGTISPAHVISVAVWHLLRAPGLREVLLHDTALIPAFVEEVMRLDPPERSLPRLTTSAVGLGGVALPVGANVLLCVAAANRDPKHHDAPHELSLTRPPGGHVSFGHGLHHCTGAILARQVTEAALRTLLTQSRGFTAADPPDARAGQPVATYPQPARLMIHIDIGARATTFR